MLFNPQMYYVMVLKQLNIYEAVLHTPDTIQQQKLINTLRPMLSLSTFDNFDTAYETHKQIQNFINSYKKQKLNIETQLIAMEANFDVQVNSNFGPLQPVTYV
jgi:prenyltransferase beta subunit